MSHDPPLPEVFRSEFEALEEHRYSRPGTAYENCFGCGPEHPIGLRVRCFKTPEGVVSPVIIPARFAGPPGAAHGGIVGGYLDEVLAGAAVLHSGRIYMTGELTVRYVRPVPVETPLLGKAWVVHDYGRYVDLEGTLEDYRSHAILATARGRFLPMRADAA